MSGSNHVFAPGTKFGQYEIVRLLGRGGMGAVYESIHLGLKKRVALKTLHEQFGERADMVTRFMREGQAAARIRHAHVVDVSDVGICDDTPYLVMEFLEGEDLQHLLTREGPIQAARLADIMLPVMSAVVAAHDAGIVHRDLKPENIFLTRGRSGELHPKVLDFGISRLVDAAEDLRLTNTRAMLGSPFYMSPEQTRGSKSVDSKSDQYSLGVILYECSTGKRPFSGDSLYELMQAIVSAESTPPSFITSVPINWDAMIQRAMNRAPEDRYPSVAALGRELLAFASERTRAIWAHEFINADMGQAPTVSAAVAAVPAATEAESKPNLGSTTMGGAASEIASGIHNPPTRSGRGWIWGTMALAVLATGVGVTMRSISTRGSTQPANAAGSLAASTTSHAATTTTPTPTASAYQIAVNVIPASATIELDGAPVATGALSRSIPRDGSEHSIRITATGFQPRRLTFRDAPPPEHVELTALPIAPVAAAPPVAPVTASGRTHGSRHGAHGGPAAAGAPSQTSTAPATSTPPPTTANGAPILN